MFRRCRQTILGLTAGLTAGCTCDRDQSVVEPEPEPVWGCREVAGAGSLSVRASGQPASGEAAALFAVELGRAGADREHILIPYLDHDGKTQRARLLVTKAGLGSGTTIDLGEVHGDAAPPQAALAEQRLVVAVADRDASGESYRLGEWTLGAAPSSDVRWLAEINGGDDRSPAFDVAASGQSALLLWDDWDSSEGHGFVRSVAVIAGAAQNPVRLSEPKVDVEAPRVVARQAGYWVLWTALGLPSSSEPNARATAPAEATAASGDAPQVLKVTERWIQLLKLTEQGLPEGDVIDVTARDGYVVGFDVLAGHHGSVLIAYRDGQSSPGIGGGSIFTASVTPSGHVDIQPVAEDEVGTGIPTLNFDPNPDHGAPHGWLSYTEPNGDARLVPLSPIGVPLSMGEEHPSVEEGLLLAAQNGVLTLARPKGRDMELFLLRCGFAQVAPAPTLGEPTVEE